MTEPLLFVSHDAAPTGAPFLLLHLLRWLRSNTKFEFIFALGKPGQLESQFAELGKVTVFAGLEDSLSDRILQRLVPYRIKRAMETSRFQKELGAKKFALVYSNTLVNGRLLGRLPDQKCPLISHAHELQYMIARHTTPADLEYTLTRTNQFIAGSQAVARNLQDAHGIDKSRIAVLQEFIPMAGLDSGKLGASALELRSELAIDKNAFVVGAAGTVDWRKGYDLFVPLALNVIQKRPSQDVHFVWVGGMAERTLAEELQYDLCKLGLQGRVHFVGHRKGYLEYLAMFDAFCLTSREDPFPLVVLESAALSKPLLCFAGSGGAPEFIEDDCGFVVSYLDVVEMASRLVELIDSPILRSELGRRAASKVRERNDVAVIAPLIGEIIEQTISSQK